MFDDAVDTGEDNNQENDHRARPRNRESVRPPDRYEAHITECNEPVIFAEAMRSSEADKCKCAIEEKLEAHENNGTWKIVPLPPGKKPIDSKWVFKLKNTVGGAVRYKARLCARGFSQRLGVDYKKTFSPVVRYDSLRTLLAIAAEQDLEISQFDVKTAFLYGQLEEEVYMKIPEGLQTSNVNEEKKVPVCKLVKALYGLKQASRCWNEKFTAFLKKFKFSECESYKCVFKEHINNNMILLALYVDDGLIFAKSKETINIIIDTLGETFQITIGNANVFVGMQIERDRVNKTMSIH